MADDDRGARSPGPASRGVEAGRRRGDAADLGEGAVVGDDAAPAVGAEARSSTRGARARKPRGTPRASPRRSPAARGTPRRARSGSRAPCRPSKRIGDLATPPARRGRCRGGAGRCRRSRRGGRGARAAGRRLVGARARVGDPVEAVEARRARPSSRRASSPARRPSGGSPGCARRRARARAAPSCGRSPRGRAGRSARARPRRTPGPRRGAWPAARRRRRSSGAGACRCGCRPRGRPRRCGARCPDSGG